MKVISVMPEIVYMRLKEKNRKSLNKKKKVKYISKIEKE